MEIPNVSYIENLAGEDLVFKQKLIKIIKLEFPVEFSTYTEHIATKNYKEAAEIVHKLKNKISMLGLTQGYLLAQEYEEALKKGHIEKHTSFLALIKIMDQYIKAL